MSSHPRVCACKGMHTCVPLGLPSLGSFAQLWLPCQRPHQRFWELQAGRKLLLLGTRPLCSRPVAPLDGTRGPAQRVGLRLGFPPAPCSSDWALASPHVAGWVFPIVCGLQAARAAIGKASVSRLGRGGRFLVLSRSAAFLLPRLIRSLVGFSCVWPRATERGEEGRGEALVGGSQAAGVERGVSTWQGGSRGFAAPGVLNAAAPNLGQHPAFSPPHPGSLLQEWVMLRCTHGFPVGDLCFAPCCLGSAPVTG